jgi:rhamnogalacturonyl hydrolase YesR
MTDVIARGLSVAQQQSLILAKEAEGREGQLPRNYTDSQLETTNLEDWTSGFFGGTLWYIYENSQSEEVKKYAEMYTLRVENAKYITGSHDVGFMLGCSFGNGYRLTDNPDYLEVMKTGAASLFTRFNPTVGAIRSWDWNREKWQYPVIIDNMMNLELLMFISKKTGEERYAQIAETHAATTLKNHFRDDGSSFHVVSYDTLTGLPHAKNTHQGYADSSAWARGQAWALYGYTMMYRETGKAEYLDQAKGIASFLMNHPNMPADKVPYWDFNAPDIPDAPRDASAAAIMASALIELSTLEKGADSPLYLEYAEDQLRSLSSPAYLAEVGTNGGFILKHSVGHLPGQSEIDVPIIYADYYYVEALTRIKNLSR